MSDKSFADAVKTITPSYLALLKKPGANAPPPDTARGIARVGEVDPGWLSFGELSGAPAPEGFPPWLQEYRSNLPENLPKLKKKTAAQFTKELSAKNKKDKRA